MSKAFKISAGFILILVFALFTFWRYREGTAIRERERQQKQFVSTFERLNAPRNFIDESIREIFPEPQASLMSGILLGTKASFPPELFLAMKKTGVLHVIALSGQNISILIAAISGFLLPFWGRRPAAFFSVVVIVAFISFVGPSASVVRAGIMGGMAMLSVVFGREYISLLGLFLAGLVMVLWEPVVVGDVGFQLSFMASLGIIILGGRVYEMGAINSGKEKREGDCGLGEARRGARDMNYKARIVSYFAREMKTLFSEVRSGVVNNLRVALAAQIFTLPVLAVNFGQLSLISPVVNVLVVWLVPFVMVWGGVAALTALTFHGLGVFLAYIVFVPLTYFIRVVEFFGRIPFASASFSEPSLAFGFFYYGFLFIVLSFRSLRRAKRRLFIHNIFSLE